MRVIGTAGHVDHGKSALVLALTGINPDRLREEQERQMTIDLGFAWLSLPEGESVGIVDVPGHRDFIENMLAGVGSIDAALFVIAADEGVMPQTREHLAILDLLQIKRGVVALSKLDLVQDEEWLELVREDVRSILATTSLAEAPILPVSAHTGAGLDELVQVIQAVLNEAPVRKDIGQPRLSVDRAFSISGFGTVVTGTLVEGTLHVGDEVEIYPKGLQGRIRGLQTHKEQVGAAVPGSRVAVNISGIDVDNVERGDVVAHPGTASKTRRIDVQFELLKSNELPVKHNQEVKLFIGAAQRIARVRLLGASELMPGQEGWLQLEFDAPIVTARGDRYILRRPSPPATIGGGQVVDAHPERRHRRRDPAVIERLEQYLIGDPKDVLIQTIQRMGPSDWKSITELAGLELNTLEHARVQAVESGQIIQLAGTSEASVVYLDAATWGNVVQTITQELEEFHAQYKLRHGMSVEELRSRLQLDPKVAGPILNQAEMQGVIENTGKIVRLASFQPELDKEQHLRVESLLGKFRDNPFSTPSVKESIAQVGEDVLRYLLDTGELIQLSEDVLLTDKGYEKMLEEIKALFAKKKTITVAEVRDHLDTSRKYVLAMLEHLDTEGITKREGDLRRLV